ncbi:MAG TPA: hypothetical protein VN397_00025 [Candidatus Methylomirabilis sp.]|nr:hypothetical protein [Candidatus Methylomirabilis sp.]
MRNITVDVRPSARKKRKWVVEINADKLERLAAALGMYNPDFLNSLERAESDVRAGKIRSLRSLKSLL